MLHFAVRNMNLEGITIFFRAQVKIFFLNFLAVQIVYFLKKKITIGCAHRCPSITCHTMLRRMQWKITHYPSRAVGCKSHSVLREKAKNLH